MAQRRSVIRLARRLTTPRGRAQLLLAAANRTDSSVVSAASAKTTSRPAKEPGGSGASRSYPAAEPTSTAGSRVTSMFFDQHPRFYESSETGPSRGRLNLRYDAIFAENRDIFDGARVLDIASHDGRWSFAALSAGAAHVTGIEARPELVDEAHENMRAYDVAEDRFRFVAGNIFAVLADEALEFDVVMCLGFLYHTLRYNELMYRINSMRPRHLVVDTEIYNRTREPLIHLRVEPVARQGNAVSDDFSVGDGVMSGRPSLAALHKMMAAYGYPIVRTSDWGGIVRDNEAALGVGDYAAGTRTTVVGQRSDDPPPSETTAAAVS